MLSVAFKPTLSDGVELYFSKTIVLIYSSFEISVLGVIFSLFYYFFVSTKSGKSYLSD